MKLIAFYTVAAAAFAFAFQANQTNALASAIAPSSQIQEKTLAPAKTPSSFWNVVGSKAYLGGEDGVNEPNVKPSYGDLAKAWLQ